MTPLNPLKRLFNFCLLFVFLSTSVTSFASPNVSKKNLWSNWDPIEEQKVDVPEYNPLSILPAPSGPGQSLNSLDLYKTSPKESPLTVALKASDMISSLSAPLENIVSHSSIITAKELPQKMMNKADDMSQEGALMYQGLRDMFSSIEGMKQELKTNYQTFNTSDQTAKASQELNSQSDHMADRLAAMRQSYKGITERAQFNSAMVQGMMQTLSDTALSGQESKDYYGKLTTHIKEISTRFELMTKELDKQGLASPVAFDEVRQYLSSFGNYVQAYKQYNADEATYVHNVKTYLSKISGYLDKVTGNLGQTDDYLIQMEQYFRSAKVQAAQSMKEGNGLDVIDDPDQAICSTLTDAPESGPLAKEEKKGKPLESLQHCQKHCRTVCRFKKNSGDTHCYECPSGSPDTCYDVGGLPQDHAWCKPGGICYDDPMLYCSPYGAVGPNLMKLNCTACLDRADECAANVGPETMTYTNCVTNCADGECKYKGKYQKPEWDGKAEHIHCFQCKRPPGPPSCEDLGWGTTNEQMCMKDCPDGKCKQVKISIGLDGKPRAEDPNAPKPPPPGPGGNNGGQQGDGQAGQPGQNGQSPDGGSTGGTQEPTSNPGDGGKTPNPPTTGPSGPGAGGGSVAGAGTQEQPSGIDASKPTGSSPTPVQNPPQAPSGGSAPKEPPQPGTQEKPKAPEEPTIPLPSNPDIDFYKKWLAEVNERIKSRQDILDNDNEGYYTKTEAKSQQDSMNKTKEYLESRIKELEQRDLEKAQKEADERKRREEWEKSRPKTVDFEEEIRRKTEEWRLKNLKTATDNLRTIAQEAKDSIEARTKRIEDTAKEIARLERENQYFTNPEFKNDIDQTVARDTVKRNQERINDLKRMQAEFTRKLQEAQRKYEQEIEKAKSEYRKALWQLDDNARRLADVERIDEYFDLASDLHRRKEARALRTETFNSIANDLENARKAAEANGNSSEADKLKRKLDNLRREQDEWTKTQERLEGNIENQMFEIGQRNFSEGAGPSSEERLNEKLAEYSKLLEEKLKDPKLSKDQKAALQATLEGIKEKQQSLSGSQLDNETKERIIQSTTRVANASMNQDPDKSFLRLAAESLAEESVHNMNPLVMAKKSLAFGWGMAKGVGTAVAGVAELGWGATKLIAQSTAVNLGFEDGGIFGTSAIDTLSSVLTTAGDNANFNGLFKATLAAGKAIDDKIKELEKSRDIDWATAELGGKIVGENVVGPEMIGLAAGAALSKAKTLMRGAEVATEAAATAGTIERAAQTAGSAANKLDEAATTAAKLEKAGQRGVTALEETAQGGKTAPKPVAERPAPVVETKPSATAERPAPEAKTAPSPEPPAATQPRAPPVEPAVPLRPNETPHKSVGAHEEVTFVNEQGQKITVKTGEELGKGSTSTAFVDANNPNKVVRVTELGVEGSPHAATLDKVGREAVEHIQTPDGPIRIVEKGERYVVRDPANPSKGKVIEVVERVQNGSADKFLPKQGGSMTAGQAEAFDLATRELNKNGYAWMDNHTGNYGFEKIPGTDDKWRVVVIDSGGIVPAKGATLAERAENASLIQKKINVPSEEYLDGYEMTKRIQNERIKKGIADDARRDIVDEIGSKIDTKAMGLGEDIRITKAGMQNDFPNGDEIYDWLNNNKVFSNEGTAKDLSKAVKDGLYEAFPDQADDILKTLRQSKAVADVAFYPGGTLEFKGVQELSKMSLDEALAFHATRK